MASPLGKGMVIMKRIQLPIVIVDKNGTDLSIHSSLENAKARVEAIDITNDEYVFYDFEGRLLFAKVKKEKRPILFGIFRASADVVLIEQAEDEPMHVEELRQALIDFLKGVDPGYQSSWEEDLGSLIKKCLKAIE
jgi:hypothetical protein